MKAMLEQSGKIDETQQRMKHLLWIEEAGRADGSTYEEKSEIGYVFEERIMDFITSAPEYNGNPELVFEWCKNLENDLLNQGKR